MQGREIITFGILRVYNSGCGVSRSRIRVKLGTRRLSASKGLLLVLQRKLSIYASNKEKLLLKTKKIAIDNLPETLRIAFITISRYERKTETILAATV